MKNLLNKICSSSKNKAEQLGAWISLDAIRVAKECGCPGFIDRIKCDAYCEAKEILRSCTTYAEIEKYAVSARRLLYNDIVSLIDELTERGLLL